MCSERIPGNALLFALATQGFETYHLLGQFVVTEGGFAYANELVECIRSRYDFCIGVAGYPEGHPQCLNRTRDQRHAEQLQRAKRPVA